MKNDRRVRYTHMVLKEALLDLLKDRPIERISVKEICDKADINRSTFYVHYGSPQELLDSIKNDMYDEIKQANTGFENMHTFLRDIFDVVYKYKKLMRLLTQGLNHLDIIFNIFDFWKDDFKAAMLEMGMPEDKWDDAYLFIACGTSAVLCVWTLDMIKKTSAEIADEVYALICNGLNAYVKEDDNHV